VDVLLFADTTRSPELRHELPLAIPDPVLYAECGGLRHVVGASFEGPRLEELGGCVFHPFEEFGLDELRASGIPRSELLDEIVVRAARSLGVSSAVVPATFPLLTGDRLRAAGVTLMPDQSVFDDRRRVKSGAELEGIRRALAAAEAGMAAARELLQRARPNAGGVLELDGRPLDAARVKQTIAQAFLEHGASADEFVVSHGGQAAIGHHMGEGELRAGEPIIIDLWPRDTASACYADMTRTFFVGEPPAELARWHALCKQVLDRVVAGVREGVTGAELFGAACDLFEAAGHETQRSKPEGQVLDHGFHHALGHGVGLNVHEEPTLARNGRLPLVAGDVLAVEPGLYRPGYGGVRLEDLVLVTASGSETLTRFPYALAP